MYLTHPVLSILLASFLTMACGSSSNGQNQPEGNDEAEAADSHLVTNPRSVAVSHEFWVDPESQAARDALTLRNSDPEAARQIQIIADQPMAQWLGEWSGDVERHVHDLKRKADGKTMTLVLYHIPFRDCGSYSAGGSQPREYLDWVQKVARGLASHQAWIIVEPDALAQMDCLTPAAQKERLALVKEAVRILKNLPGVRVYLDAGHPAWKPADLMAERLLQAGVMAADGFALNVSNYQTDAANITYGQTLRSKLAGKNFVIDTSRNGRGPDPDGIWCNPRSRALGRFPTGTTHIEGVDAFLWIKRPGESDGSCNGGPGAGQWWREIALEMTYEAGL